MKEKQTPNEYLKSLIKETKKGKGTKPNSLKNKVLLSELEEYLDSKKHYSFEKEVLFNKIMDTKRQYRADFVIRDVDDLGQVEFIIVEINGGSYVNGRHTRAGKVPGKDYTQYENDLNKLNLAQKNGFKTYQFTYEMLARKEYEKFI